jgi:hypothetical protein
MSWSWKCIHHDANDPKDPCACLAKSKKKIKTRNAAMRYGRKHELRSKHYCQVLVYEWFKNKVVDVEWVSGD